MSKSAILNVLFHQIKIVANIAECSRVFTEMVPADPSQCGSARKSAVSCDGDKLSDEEYILKRKRNNDAVNRFVMFRYAHSIKF